MLHKYFVLLFSALLSVSIAHADTYDNYPVFGGYPGARLTVAQTVDYDAFKFPTSTVDARNYPYKVKEAEVKGKIFQHFYEINKVSTLQVFENYTTAITKAGFQQIFSCKLNACGSENEATALGEHIAINNKIYSMHEKPYYILATKSNGNAKVYGAWFIGGLNGDVAVQQVIVEEKPLETGLIDVNPDALKQQIDTDGKALIYGIYFDTGKANVKPDSKPTMDAIAKLLTKNKDLLLYVVGHTDDTGVGASNVELSRQRALAVVNVLVSDYKIPATRLQAQGLGPYAPASNNTSEDGKQKNRRVELVKRLQ